MGAIEPRAVRRIAVLRALQLGDLLVAVPALRSLRAGFPEAEITLIGLPWAAWFAARFSHYLDRFVAFGGAPGIDEVELDEARMADYLAAQRAHGYDLAVQLHGSGGASNPAVLALGARCSAGCYVGQPPAGLTVAVPYPDELPEPLRLLRLTAALGCPERGTQLEFPLRPEDAAEADALLAPLAGQMGPWIGLHCGARAPARRWPPARFASLADALARRHGAAIVLSGGPDEDAIAAEVAGLMEAPALNLAGQTSLGGLAALISRLDLFISNDTGPAHLARALDTPSVTIFGPAEFPRWAPLDSSRHRLARQFVHCSPCAHRECPIDHRCLRGVSTTMVLSAAESLLADVRTTKGTRCAA
ncbi:MAG TPA: glycosyltransferase family 9 protein [Thermomicrobiaceae bacterium]|nr:glycosyltransferase family 9 protein [Thermomicrobiaceae bacterium]